MSRFFLNTVIATNTIAQNKYAQLAKPEDRMLSALGDVEFGQVFYRSFLTRYTSEEFGADIFGAIIYPIGSLILTAIALPFALIALALAALLATLAIAFCVIAGLVNILTGQFTEGFTLLAMPILGIIAAAVIFPIVTLLGWLAFALEVAISWVSLVTSSIATVGACIGDLFVAGPGPGPGGDFDPEEGEGSDHDDEVGMKK